MKYLKKEVGGVPGNVLGMFADLALKLRNGVITPGEFGKFLKKENPFDPENYSEEIGEWEYLYDRLFGKEYHFSVIRIPEKPGGSRWRLLILVDISLEQLYAKCKELFPCWRWTDDNLDKIVTWNERDAKNGPYAVWVRDETEADEKLKNLSANDIKTKGITTETLAERLIHELKFFDETGKHLDVKNTTLCAGSRYSDGNVPSVSRNPDGGELDVDWCNPDDRDDDLRAREAVS